MGSAILAIVNSSMDKSHGDLAGILWALINCLGNGMFCLELWVPGQEGRRGIHAGLHSGVCVLSSCTHLAIENESDRLVSTTLRSRQIMSRGEADYD